MKDLNRSDVTDFVELLYGVSLWPGAISISPSPHLSLSSASLRERCDCSFGVIQPLSCEPSLS